MDETTLPGTETSERRRGTRAQVAGVAVLQSPTQPPSVWRVTNLSTGGAGLVGDGPTLTGPLSLTLHVAGFPAIELHAKVLRRQVLTRSGRCAIRFTEVSAAQTRSLRDIVTADHAPSNVRRRALVITPDERRAGTLGGELARLGFAVRRESSPGQAVAWLQREETEVVLVDESVVEADRWSLLQFVRDTSPETRRLVIANDVRGFRLYYAIKAGLVESLVEPKTSGDALARHVLGAPAAVSSRRARSAR
jgi:hypothetical protein